jgi:hypothetical protein
MRLPVATIRNAEQSHRDPVWRTLFRLANALGVSVEEFQQCVDQPAAVVLRKKRKEKQR